MKPSKNRKSSARQPKEKFVSSPPYKQEHDEIMRAIGQIPEGDGGEHDIIMEMIRGNDGDERY